MENPRIRTAALLLLLAVCACAPTLPFQQGSGQATSYGYSDTRLDATHYSVAYADNNAVSANAFLELRAAQIAKGAGFSYFAFDKRGDAVLRQTENDLSSDGRVRAHDATGRPFNPMENVPTSNGIEITSYFYAVGQISLLTDDQARTNPKALRVNDVLARSGGTAP